jgi:hypothetical protein
MRQEPRSEIQEESGCALVEPEFSNLRLPDTNFKWIAGNPDKPTNPSYCHYKNHREKYFGDGGPSAKPSVSETMGLQGNGVVEDLPPNTDFPITTFISYSTLNTLAGKEGIAKVWGNDSHNAFIVLKRRYHQRRQSVNRRRSRCPHTERTS